MWTLKRPFFFRIPLCFPPTLSSIWQNCFVPFGTTLDIRKDLLISQLKNLLNTTICFVSFFFIRFSMNACYALVWTLVGPSGLEPPTSCLSGTRSNLLSYEPMWLGSDRVTWSPTSLSTMDDGIRSRRSTRLGRSRSKRSTGSFFCTARIRIPSESRNRMRFLWNRVRFLGGDDGIRTHDPLLAGQVLSQLSYTPIRVLFSCIPYRVRDAVSAMTYPPTPSPA